MRDIREVPAGCQRFSVDAVYGFSYYTSKYRLPILPNDHRRCFFLDGDMRIDVLFAPGKIDNFCVYELRRDAYGNTTALRTSAAYCFMNLRKLCDEVSLPLVWRHAWRLYDITGRDVDGRVLFEIDYMSTGYPPSYQGLAKESLLLLYYSMIAEEWKEGSFVFRKIKMVGLYRYLIKGLDFRTAAYGLCGVSPGEVEAEFLEAEGYRGLR